MNYRSTQTTWEMRVTRKRESRRKERIGKDLRNLDHLPWDWEWLSYLVSLKSGKALHAGKIGARLLGLRFI